MSPASRLILHELVRVAVAMANGEPGVFTTEHFMAACAADFDMPPGFLTEDRWKAWAFDVLTRASWVTRIDGFRWRIR